MKLHKTPSLLCLIVFRAGSKVSNHLELMPATICTGCNIDTQQTFLGMYIVGTSIYVTVHIYRYVTSHFSMLLTEYMILYVLSVIAWCERGPSFPS